MPFKPSAGAKRRLLQHGAPMLTNRLSRLHHHHSSTPSGRCGLLLFHYTDCWRHFAAAWRAGHGGEDYYGLIKDAKKNPEKVGAVGKGLWGGGRHRGK
jgi:hypothetical protein